MDDKLDKKLLEKIDESRRSALKKLILGSAFAVPVIASFSMGGLGVVEAHVAAPNQTKPPKQECAPPHKNDKPPKIDKPPKASCDKPKNVQPHSVSDRYDSHGHDKYKKGRPK